MAVVDISNTYQLTNTGAHLDNTDVYNSNKNLLDNPFFTINQREFTSSTATNGVYTVDRWRINNGGGTGGTVTRLSSGYIKLQTGTNFITFDQRFGSNELEGKTVTLSVNDGGTIYSKTGIVPARTSENQNPISYAYKTGATIRLHVMNTASPYGYIYQVNAAQGYTNTIRAAKVEIGSYSTLANDAPPDYKSELDKCKYYCNVIKGNSYSAVGMATAATSIRVPFPFVMRETPSISVTGSTLLFGPSSLTPSAITVSGSGTNSIDLAFAVTGATAKAIYLFSPSSGKIVLSADF